MAVVHDGGFADIVTFDDRIAICKRLRWSAIRFDSRRKPLRDHPRLSLDGEAQHRFTAQREGAELSAEAKCNRQILIVNSGNELLSNELRSLVEHGRENSTVLQLDA